MADYYLIQIGDVVLSDDGTSEGRPCRLEVEGLSALFSAYSGQTVMPISGRPFNFVREHETRGVRIITRPFVLMQDELDDIKDLFEAAIASGEPISFTISDGPVEVAVDCDPLFEGDLPPIHFESSFTDERVYGVQIRAVTRGLTPEEEP